MSTPKSTPTTPQRLIAYVRVSTAAQVANGDSTTAQAEAIHAWALEAGHQVVEIMAMRASPARSRPKTDQASPLHW
jgi:DNA invertase Pin-like site-specific DNA recombinase